MILPSFSGLWNAGSILFKTSVDGDGIGDGVKSDKLADGNEGTEWLVVSDEAGGERRWDIMAFVHGSEL